MPSRALPDPMWEPVFATLLNCPKAFGSGQFRDSADLVRSVRKDLLEHLDHDKVGKALAKQNILLFEKNP